MYKTTYLEPRWHTIAAAAAIWKLREKRQGSSSLRSNCRHLTDVKDFERRRRDPNCSTPCELFQWAGARSPSSL